MDVHPKEYSLFSRTLLQKRLIISSSLVANPYMIEFGLTVQIMGKVHFEYKSFDLLTQIQSCMGWLRLVGSLKLYVAFAKEP